MGYNIEEYELIENEKTIAEIVKFDNGLVVVNWCLGIDSIVVYKDIDDFKKVSLNGKRSLINIHVKYAKWEKVNIEMNI